MIAFPNGNMRCMTPDGACDSSAGLVITWNSFNMAAHVRDTPRSLNFDMLYDTAHSRIERCSPNCTSPTTTTLYLNDPATGTMEEAAIAGGTTSWTDYIAASGGIVAIRNSSGGTSSYMYVTGDHLGSVSLISDASGGLGAGGRQSYDPWGQRRNADGTPASSCSAKSSPTTRGYTGQEEMDSGCLVNLNGRMYYPVIGRMLSADPFIPNPMNTQSYNRYSYVNNNPLNAIDPSGYIETITVTGHLLPIDPLTEGLSDPGILGLAGNGSNFSQYGSESGAVGSGSNGAGGSAPVGPTFKAFGWNDTRCIICGGYASLSTMSYYNFIDNGSLYETSSGLLGRWTMVNTEEENDQGQFVPTGTTGWVWAPFVPFVGGAGVGASAVQYGSGAATLGSNLRLYSSGWGGNQYVSTFKLTNFAEKLANRILVLSVGLDVAAWYQGHLSTQHLGANLTMDAVGAFGGPVGAAYAGAYYGLETFYPGGAAGALTFYGNIIEHNQAMTGQPFYSAGKISFHPKQKSDALPPPDQKKKRRDREVIDPYAVPMDREKT